MDKLRNIKLMITDIGGVLVKTDEAILSSIEQVFERNNIEHGSRSDMLKAFGVSIWDYVFNFLAKHYKGNERRLLADWLYEEFTHMYPDKVKNKLRVFDGVEETLFYLNKKGVRLAVISCMSRHEVNVNLSLLKFRNWDVVLSLEDYKKKRPDPVGLLMIVERATQRVASTKVGAIHELPLRQIAYIGDTVADIKMAKNAGVMSIAVRSGMQDSSLLEAEKPDYLIDGIWEIEGVL